MWNWERVTSTNISLQLPQWALPSHSSSVFFLSEFFPLTKERATANTGKKGEMNTQVQVTESVLQVHLSCFATYRNLANGKD